MWFREGEGGRKVDCEGGEVGMALVAMVNCLESVVRKRKTSEGFQQGTAV